MQEAQVQEQTREQACRLLESLHPWYSPDAVDLCKKTVSLLVVSIAFKIHTVASVLEALSLHC